MLLEPFIASETYDYHTSTVHEEARQHLDSAIEHMDRWTDVLGVNLMGVVHGCQAFGEAMVAQQRNAVIVNTGSKQGITMPPGDTAYNVSKSGVKTLTEGLQHALRTRAGCKVNAFLLVPGWMSPCEFSTPFSLS